MIEASCSVPVGRPLSIRQAEPSDLARWDGFVAAHPAGTLFHRFAWGATIARAFGHAPLYLLAERDGAVAGVLPLIHKRSRLFGDGLVSTPYCSYGGAVAESESVARRLEDHAEAAARRLGVGFVEMRNSAARRDDWVQADTLYASFRRPIPPDDAAVIRSVSSKGRRHELKKSLRRGLRLEIDGSAETFYAMLSESFRNHGTPIFSRSWFRLLRDAFGPSIETYAVHDGAGALTASMAFYFRDEVHPLYTGGGHRARETQANDFLYLRMMARARERGAAVFDFGRSKRGTGAFDNKRHWGFEPQPLSYAYRLLGRAAAPDLNPASPRYRLLVAMWRRLPLSVSRCLGPMLGPHLG